MTENTETQDAIEAGVAMSSPHPIGDGNRFYAVILPGQTPHVIDIEKHRDTYLDRPRRKTGTTTVHDADSFITYVAKHGLPNTEIYADVTTSRLVAVINAHDQAFVDSASEGDAGWGDHRLVLQLHKTPAWTAWAKLDRNLLSQVAFAEHVEERLVDFRSPPGADMLEVAQTFQATRSAAFESSHRLSNGQVQIGYREELDAKAGKKGQVAVPTDFALQLVPYEGGQAYKVDARFRYRLADGALTVGYLLTRPDDILRAAFLDEVTAIAVGTERAVLNGTPG